MLASPASSPQSAAVGANQSSVDNLVATSSSIVFSLGIPFNGKWQLHVKYYQTNRVKQVLIAAYI
jgi:hypothetical protein